MAATTQIVSQKMMSSTDETVVKAVEAVEAVKALKERQKETIAKLLEAMLVPNFCDNEEHAKYWFRYPKTDKEIKFCAEQVQSILNKEGRQVLILGMKSYPVLTYEMICVLPSCFGKTIFQVAESIDGIAKSSQLKTVFEKHLALLKKEAEMVTTLIPNIVKERHKKEEAHKSSFQAQLESIAEELRVNLETLKKIKLSINEVAQSYYKSLPVLEKNTTNERKINKKFQTILETVCKLDEINSIFYTEFMVSFVETTINLVDIYPSLLLHESLTKPRNDKLKKLLKNLPLPIKRATQKVLGLNSTLRLVGKFRALIEAYNPYYCNQYNEYIRGINFNDASPASINFEPQDAFRQINRKFRDNLCIFVSKELDIVIGKFTELFGKDLHVVFFHKGKLLESLNSFFPEDFNKESSNVQCFRRLTVFSTMLKDLTTGLYQMIEKLHGLWITQNKNFDVQSVIETAIASFFIESVSFEEVDARDRRTQKMLESKKREEAARIRAIEEKHKIETMALAKLSVQKESKLKMERESILTSLKDLDNTEVITLWKILQLGRSLHHQLETETFCKIAKKLPPFSIGEATDGYELFYNKQFICSFHREHKSNKGKKLDGNVLGAFVLKIVEPEGLNLKSEMLKRLSSMSSIASTAAMASLI